MEQAKFAGETIDLGNNLRRFLSKSGQNQKSKSSNDKKERRHPIKGIVGGKDNSNCRTVSRE